MAIFRKKSPKAIEFELKTLGVTPTADDALAANLNPTPAADDSRSKYERIADFSYQNDSLAELIVRAWTDEGFKDHLLKRELDGTSPNAKKELAERGIYLEDPVVITEDHYFDGFSIEEPDSNRVVFVLPKFERVETQRDSLGLLETARLLMACTPNGI